MAFLKEEIKAGIIVISSMFILSAFVILVGGSEFFKKLDRYSVRVMNAAGIEEGAQVRLGGVRVGRVLSVRPPVSAGEPVIIEIGLQKGTVLYRGTKAAITQVGMVGDMYLLLSIEKTTGEPIQVGEVIPSEEQLQFGVIMAKLNTISESVDVLIRDINKLFTQENINELSQILKNTNKAIVSGSEDITKVATAFRNTSAKVEAALFEIEEMVKSNKGEVALLLKRARESVEKATVTMSAIEKAATTLDKTATTLDGTVKTTEKVIDHQSQNLDVLLTTLTRATEDLRDVLHELKSKPWGVIYREDRKKGE